MSEKRIQMPEWTPEEDQQLLNFVLPLRIASAAGEGTHQKWPPGIWARAAEHVGRSVNGAMRRYYLLTERHPAPEMSTAWADVTFTDSPAALADDVSLAILPPPALGRSEATA